MAALTPPVFHPDAIKTVAEEVLAPIHDEWNAWGFQARRVGNDEFADFAAARQNTIWQASSLLRFFVPKLTLNQDGSPKGVFLPHPLDLLFPVPDSFDLVPV
jgi:hypothetical protein